MDVINRASELINAKTGYVWEGYAALSLIDENGYPCAATFAIVKADGINWLTFATRISRGYAERISQNNKACVCINSSEYNINLVGTVQACTDITTKQDMWIPNTAMEQLWDGPDDPDLLILRFHTERYSLWFKEDWASAAGNLQQQA
ncbi:MAG: pyridoxamine 5'-phosphate oxidase family protein [Oscillospiraceae bacterium]|nr:pyridoxamine 5'-phosphate oxidase family protein [Oscillospiraceae bacterium]